MDDNAAATEPVQSPITGRGDVDPMTPAGALGEFYRAFNSADLALMERNWEDSPEAVMDNPLGGIMRGWAQIRSVYERIFQSPWRVEVEFYDYTLHVAGDVFWAIGRERGQVGSGAGALRLAIRTTRLFRRPPGGRWRQVHHHGSFEDPHLLLEYQSRVGRRQSTASLAVDELNASNDE